MPTTLTLKNIPDAVYQRLKAAAEQHRRSMARGAPMIAVDTKVLAYLHLPGVHMNEGLSA